MGVLGFAIGALIVVAFWELKDRQTQREWRKFVESIPKPIKEDFTEENAVLLSDVTTPGLEGDYFAILYERHRIYLMKSGNFFHVFDVGQNANSSTRHEDIVSPYIAMIKLWRGRTDKGEEVLKQLRAIDELVLYHRLPAISLA